MSERTLSRKSRLINLVGQTFGRLTVLARAENTSKGDARWRCECDCGITTIVYGYNLQTGNSRSCGCLKREMLTKHGHLDTPTYHTWEGMKQRCANQRSKQYSRYGGRGIKICEQWMEFSNFLADMGERPEGMSLDRRENSKGYFKSNCRWSTPSEQQRNTRRNRLITMNGETHCVTEWCEKLKIKRYVVDTRLRRGWTEAQALYTPVRKR